MELVEIITQMVVFTKEVLSKESLMAMEDLLWLLGIIIRDKLNSEELMAMEFLKVRDLNIREVLKIMSGMVKGKKKEKIHISLVNINMDKKNQGFSDTMEIILFIKAIF